MVENPPQLRPSQHVRDEQLRWVERLAEDLGMDARTLTDPALFPDATSRASMDALRQQTHLLGSKALYAINPKDKKPARYSSYQPELVRMMDAMFDEYLMAWNLRQLATNDVAAGEKRMAKRLAIVDTIEAKTQEYYLSRAAEIVPPGMRHDREITSMIGLCTKQFSVAMNMSDLPGFIDAYAIEPQIRRVLPGEQATPENIVSTVLAHSRLTERTAEQLWNKA